MNRNLLGKVESALRSVFNPRDVDGVVTLSVPVQYPSGSLASIEVAGGLETVWISDRGMGFFEAENMGADLSYGRFAQAEADQRGISFDGRSVFALKLPVNQLAAGIIAVANGSAAAAVATIRYEQEKKLQEGNRKVYEKVKQAFPEADVTHQLEVDGARTSWVVHNVVRIKNRTGIFEPATNHPASVSSKFLMFSDLSARQSISLNVVVRNPKELDARGQMLRDVAQIISVDAPVEIYRKGFIH